MPEHHLVCLHEDRWKEITERSKKQGDMIEQIYQRLCVDNGKESIQTSLIRGDTRMARLETAVEELKTRPRTVLATVGTITGIGAVIGAGIWALSHIKVNP